MVKRIQCEVIRSVPLTHETCEHGQPNRANGQSALTKTVSGENAQLKPYEKIADDAAHFNDELKSNFGKSLGGHKSAEEAAQGQFLDVWA